jgi:CheY-like chemotaxis protein
VAITGNMALKMVTDAYESKEPYDVILLDIQLPDISGHDVAQSVTRLLGDDTPKIIVISAYAQTSITPESGEDIPNYSDFLSKPVTPLQLSDSVERVLNKQDEPALVNQERQKRLLGVQLLVVEDNMINREIAYELLTTEGASVDLASGGIEGVDSIMAGIRKYDLVLMDIQMPDIDGLEATRRIRADSRWSDLPIIAMTANVSLEDREACTAAGMNGHVSKPVDLEELVNTVLLAVKREFMMDKAHLPGSNTDQLIEDKITLLRRFSNNRKLFQKMQGMFSTEMQKIIDEITVCWQAKQWRESTLALHTLKGAAGTMGAIGLAARAQELEAQFKLISSNNVVDVEYSDLLSELLELVQRSDGALAGLLTGDD